VQAVVDAGGGVGGLSVRMDGRHHLDLAVSAGEVRAEAQVGTLRSVLGWVEVPAGDVVLENRAVPAEGSFSSTALGPDQLLAEVVRDGEFTELGRRDGALRLHRGGRRDDRAAGRRVVLRRVGRRPLVHLLGRRHAVTLRMAARLLAELRRHDRRAGAAH
jgi:hypothetical protein